MAVWATVDQLQTPIGIWNALPWIINEWHLFIYVLVYIRSHIQE